MKQFITQDQYDSLSDQAKQAYIAWTLAKCQETGDFTESYRSINHLIQFIDDHTIGWWRIERASTRDAWRVQAEHADFDDEGSPELCDAHWEAVKMILEGKQS